MSAIFESESLPPTARLVLLALADHADDTGRCYPSIARLCRRTGLSERAAQTNIKKMVDAGYIRIVTGGGKGNTNLYFISANPAADAPRTICTPAADAPQTPQQMRETPQQMHPNHQEPSLEPSVSKKPRKSRMPQDAEISDEMRATAEKEGVAPQEATAQFQSFKDNAHAHGKTFADWNAAWRNWLRSPFYKPKFTTIPGGQNVKPATKSQSRMDAFLSGARVSS